MNCLKYRIYWMAAGVFLFLPVMAMGQSRMDTVTLNAMVSETIVLSASPILAKSNVRIEARSDASDLTFNLSGSGPDVSAARVSILIRSNTRFKITGLVQSTTARLANLVVLDARSTGRFAAPDAAENLIVIPELDSRTANRPTQPASFPIVLSSPVTILNGPRISLAGTLNSADNALEVTLMITVKPDPGATNWIVQLTLSGSVSNL